MRAMPLLTLLLVLTGCSPEAPPVGTFLPAIAAAFGVASQETTSPDPNPTPKPDSTLCSACNGTGQLGDGRISFPCSACGGDGRLDPTDIPAIQSKQPKPQATPTKPQAKTAVANPAPPRAVVAVQPQGRGRTATTYTYCGPDGRCYTTTTRTIIRGR